MTNRTVATYVTIALSLRRPSLLSRCHLLSAVVGRPPLPHLSDLCLRVVSGRGLWATAAGRASRGRSLTPCRTLSTARSPGAGRSSRHWDGAAVWLLRSAVHAQWGVCRESEGDGWREREGDGGRERERRRWREGERERRRERVSREGLEIYCISCNTRLFLPFVFTYSLI